MKWQEGFILYRRVARAILRQRQEPSRVCVNAHLTRQSDSQAVRPSGRQAVRPPVEG